MRVSLAKALFREPVTTFLFFPVLFLLGSSARSQLFPQRGTADGVVASPKTRSEN
jgi:hypothetical protein